MIDQRLLFACSLFVAILPCCVPFAILQTKVTAPHGRPSTRTKQLCATPEDEDSSADPEGANLMSELFKAAQEKGVSIDADDLMEDDDEEEDDEDDDADGGESTAGKAGFTDDQLYNEVKDRVLDTAGGFVDYVSGAKDSDEDEKEEKPKPYAPPTKVPDSNLTAGEVILLVLQALVNNDNPTKNKGVEILFGYSSSGSQIKNEIAMTGLTPDEYADFLKEAEYKVVFDHESVSIDKGEYSFDGKKGFFTARLRGSNPQDITPVNFQLASEGSEEDTCWLIESMLIRPASMRRRRRR